MERCRGNGLAGEHLVQAHLVQAHLVQAHLEVAHGNSTVAKITSSNVVMVRVAMPSLKDGIVVADGKIGRSAPRISQRCATIKSAVEIIVAVQLVGAISLDMVGGRAADNKLGFDFRFLRIVAANSTAWSSRL